MDQVPMPDSPPQVRITLEDAGNVQEPDDGVGPAPCRTGRNNVMPIAAKPDETHGTRIEYLASTGATSIMIEHPMNGPTAAAGFSAILDSPHKAAPITVTVAMRDRKTSW